MKYCSLLTAIAFTVLSASGWAEEHKHKEGGKHKEEPKVNVTIPATSEELWKAIDAKMKELSGIIAAKNGETHEAAETVEALVDAVSSKYPNLDATAKKRVEGQAKNVAKGLDTLHDEADEGHWDDAVKKLKQVEAGIQIIRSQVAK